MSPRAATFRLPDELLDGMKEVQERDGIPQSEQVRRALRAWLEERGIVAPEKKTARKRAATRKRA